MGKTWMLCKQKAEKANHTPPQDQQTTPHLWRAAAWQHRSHPAQMHLPASAAAAPMHTVHCTQGCQARCPHAPPPTSCCAHTDTRAACARAAAAVLREERLVAHWSTRCQTAAGMLVQRPLAAARGRLATAALPLLHALAHRELCPLHRLSSRGRGAASIPVGVLFAD